MRTSHAMAAPARTYVCPRCTPYRSTHATRTGDFPAWFSIIQDQTRLPSVDMRVESVLSNISGVQCSRATSVVNETAATPAAVVSECHDVGDIGRFVPHPLAFTVLHLRTKFCECPSPCIQLAFVCGVSSGGGGRGGGASVLCGSAVTTVCTRMALPNHVCGGCGISHLKATGHPCQRVCR